MNKVYVEENPKERILAITSGRLDGIDVLDYSEGNSFYGYDTIYINHNYIYDQYLLDEFVDVTKKKRLEIDGLLANGSTFIIYNVQPSFVTNLDYDAILLELFGIEVSINKLFGTNIEYYNSQLQNLLRITDCEYYQVYFKNNTGEALARIKTTEFTISFYVKCKNSKIIVLPSFDIRYLENQKVEEAIKTFLWSLNDKNSKRMLPTWTNNYLLPDEKGYLTHADKIKREIIRLSTELEDQNRKINELSQYKYLFSEQGDILHEQVNCVFIELGFVIEEQVEKNRTDTIMSYNGTPVVVEVKGIKNSAAEKHATQLEKWVADYHSKREIEPKGFLVVNTFCNKPLSERAEDDFPEQMLGYCIKKELCLLTSLQLLCLLIDIRKNPEKKEEVVARLFETKGIFADYRNWNIYLEEQTSNV